MIVVDSGSKDNTLSICESYNLSPIYRQYTMHGDQMNYAVSLASHDWVLCMDSDEIWMTWLYPLFWIWRVGLSLHQIMPGVLLDTGTYSEKKFVLSIQYRRQISLYDFLIAPVQDLISDQ